MQETNGNNLEEQVKEVVFNFAQILNLSRNLSPGQHIQCSVRSEPRLIRKQIAKLERGLRSFHNPRAYSVEYEIPAASGDGNRGVGIGKGIRQDVKYYVTVWCENPEDE